MAFNLDTNINYLGNNFLDARQSHAEKIEDLKNWDFKEFPIPLGFEVFVPGRDEEENGNWYTFTKAWNETTGYFQIRKTSGEIIDPENPVVGGGEIFVSEGKNIEISDKLAEIFEEWDTPTE